MSNRGANILRWLLSARAGSREALGESLQACRPYLLRVANSRIDPKLKAKGGASDVVQQTFLDAQRGFDGFTGDKEADLLRWLRTLLLHNLANFNRDFRRAAKRQVDREVALDQNASASGWLALAGRDPTPSRQALQTEDAQRVQRALARLPKRLRRAVELRHQQQLTFQEIGRRLRLSTSGARVLWKRAVERLAEELEAMR
ncbi:MAG TPA: sigma-70 family RNA polymerase sigma factor [Pirellulales bacterium]|nr:sigma-70 family RNA polymerase sigma factor [Pirellulales bacterium]